jgi:gamma-glutamylcysteine synthetase
MDRIYRQYEARLKPGSMTGHEVEMPLVMKRNGMQPALEDVSSMLLAIPKIERGWEPKFESLIINGERRTEYCTSVVRKINGFADEVTTDMTIGTMELVIGPENDLSSNEEKLKRRFSVIMEAAERTGIATLGLGIQPFQKRSFDNVIPKSRYLYLAEHFGDDLIDMTVTAAAQIHVDVSKESAVRTLNTMIGFSPAIIALTANSTILEGDIDNRQEFRGTAWSVMARNNVIEEERVGTPARFASIEDWFIRVVEFKPILIARGNDYLHFGKNNPGSFSRFIERGRWLFQQ